MRVPKQGLNNILMLIRNGMARILALTVMSSRYIICFPLGRATLFSKPTRGCGCQFGDAGEPVRCYLAARIESLFSEWLEIQDAAGASSAARKIRIEPALVARFDRAFGR